MATRKRRVLIVDDHPVIREGLAKLLSGERDLELCAAVGTLKEALQALKREKPDIAVIDLSLPNGDGLELIKEIRKAGKKLPIVVLSLHDQRTYAQRALRAGATTYVEKTTELKLLLGVIRDALAGRKIALARPPDASERPAGTWEQVLSRREQEVFRYIAKGMGTRRISQEMHLSIKTIETYRENIKRKLGLANAAELSRHAVLLAGD